MQIRTPPSTLCRLAAVLAILAVTLTGCTGGAEPAEPAETASPDDSEAVLESRELLGAPTVALGEAVLELARVLEDVRYETPRGPGMRRELRAVAPAVTAVRDAADTAAQAAAQAPVVEAAAIVDQAVEQTRSAADAAEAEVAYLTRLQRIDTALLDVVAQWDRPGSQSEIRARLAALAQDLTPLRRRVRRLDPAPQPCRDMRRNRAVWVATVRSRTLRLQAQANSAGGSEFDELRAAYRRVPFGVEPRTADQGERPCWQERSEVAEAARAVRGQVEWLESALQ